MFTAALEMDSITAASSMSRLAGSAGYLGMLGGLLSGSLSCFCIVKITQAFPGMTLIEYCPKILGKVLGYGLILCYILFWLFQTIRASRQMATLTSTYLLPTTPPTVIVLVALAVTVYLVKSSASSVCRALEILTPVTIVPALILLLLSFGTADLSNLLPVFGKGIAGIVKSSAVSGGNLQGVELLLILMAYIDKPDRVLSRALLGVAVVLIVSALGVASVIANFGAREAEQLIYPLVRSLRLVQLPGAAVFFVSIWWSATFTTVAINLWVVSDGIYRLIGKGISRKSVVYLLSPVVAIGCILGSPIEFMKLIWPYNILSIAFITVIPAVLYITVKIRRLAA